MNFTWWVNRKDRTGTNIFEGGFLGLDNIGVFDRSRRSRRAATWSRPTAPLDGAVLPDDARDRVRAGGRRPASKTSPRSSSSTSCAHRRHDHQLGGTGMWDEDDGFFYDVLIERTGRPSASRYARWSGSSRSSRPLEGRRAARAASRFSKRMEWFLGEPGGSAAFIHDPLQRGPARRASLSIRERKRPGRARDLLDEDEFLSPYGVRSLSQYHAEHPYVFRWGPGVRCRTCPPSPTRDVRRQLQLARSDLDARSTGSSCVRCSSTTRYYGDDFTIECPTGSGAPDESVRGRGRAQRRLASIFLRDARAVGRCSGVARSSRRTPTGGTTSSSTSISTGTTGAASARATRPAGRASWHAPCTCSPRCPQRMSSPGTRLQQGRTGRPGRLIGTDRAQANKASTNASGSNGSRSPTPSPTPTNRTGTFRSAPRSRRRSRLSRSSRASSGRCR